MIDNHWCMIGLASYGVATACNLLDCADPIGLDPRSGGLRVGAGADRNSQDAFFAVAPVADHGSLTFCWGMPQLVCLFAGACPSGPVSKTCVCVCVCVSHTGWLCVCYAVLGTGLSCVVLGTGPHHFLIRCLPGHFQGREPHWGKTQRKYPPSFLFFCWHVT